MKIKSILDLYEIMTCECHYSIDYLGNDKYLITVNAVNSISVGENLIGFTIENDTKMYILELENYKFFDLNMSKNVLTFKIRFNKGE